MNSKNEVFGVGYNKYGQIGNRKFELKNINLIQCQIKFVERIESFEEHEEFKNNLIKEFSYKTQVYSLINEDLTKNLAFLTLDKQVMKVHKEIMIKHRYYKAMLLITNPIWEESQNTIIEVNLNSKYLIPFIIYIYTGDVNFSNLKTEDLYTFSFYCKKFLFKEIQVSVDEEIKRNNYVLSSEIIKLYELLSNSEIERGEEQFNSHLEIRQLKKENKEIKTEMREMKRENKEIKRENKEIKREHEQLKKEIKDNKNEMLEEMKKLFESSFKKTRYDNDETRD